MGKTPLTRNSEFIVGEDKVLVYVLAFLFFGLFLYGLIDAMGQHFTNLDYLNYVFIIALAPALIFFAKGRSKKIYIRINKTGIYHDEQLVTGWPNFLNAYVTQKK